MPACSWSLAWRDLRLCAGPATMSSTSTGRAVGAVRLGGATPPSPRVCDDILRRGAAVGEERPAVAEGLSGMAARRSDRSSRSPTIPRASCANLPTCHRGHSLTNVASRGGRRPRLRTARSVLFVGRLVERKGVAHLIEAIARLGSLAPRLEIVARGPSVPAWRRWRGAGVRIGGVPREDPADELQRAMRERRYRVAVSARRPETRRVGVVLLER